jgi:hypothetical protein
MCEIQFGQINGDNELKLSSDPVFVEQNIKLVPHFNSELASDLVILQCKHSRWGFWHEMRWPGENEHINVPAGSWLRIMATSHENALKFDRLMEG